MSMKSAYELAMGRLEKDKPQQKVSEETKAQLAEIDSEINARIAEKKLLLEGEIVKAANDPESKNQLRAQLASELARLEESRESKKDKIRKAAESSGK